MINNPIYRINELVPRTDISLSSYGFGIFLDPSFAKRAYEKKDQGLQQKMQESAKNTILKILFKEKYLHPPFMFVDDSILAQSFHVPGNACELGTDWTQIGSIKNNREDRNIHYDPHNVDSIQQAFGLLCLFTKWIDWTEAMLDK